MSGSGASAPAGVGSTFWSFVLAEPLPRLAVLDVGTGTGRVALALAPLARRVVGLDRDAAAIDEARRRAASAGLGNTAFLVVDAEACEYASWTPGLVTAHLCMSDAIAERAARALPSGGAFVAAAFHRDHWHETGRASRFAYDEARMEQLVTGAGLRLERLEVDREVRTFASVEAALAAAVGLQERWQADGRWFRYVKFLEDGGRTLTRSHLVVKARRP